MIISKTFRDSLIVFLISTLTMTIGSIVDGIIVSHALGTVAIAALAIGSAYNKMIELLSGVIATGTLKQCSTSIGRGKMDEANATFSLACIMCGIISILALIPVIFLPGMTAGLFGSSPDAIEIHREASDFVRGLGVGLPAVFGTALLLPIMQLDNEKRRAVRAVWIATAVNISGDLLTVFVINGSMLWIGLFTSFSQYVSFFVLLLHFRKKNCSFRFSPRNLYLKDILLIIRGGITTVFNRLATMLRNIHFNTMSFGVGGELGISANAIVDNMSGILGIPSKAFGSATLTVDSILAGEEDKKALLNMLKDALKLALFVSVILAALVGFGSGLLARLYIDASAPEFHMVTAGILCWGISLIPYTINLVIINYYQSVQRLVLANVLTVIQNYLGPALCMVVLCPFIGMNGIWISIFAGKFLASIALFIIICIKKRRIAWKLEDYLCLPDNFNAETEDEKSITIRNIEEVLGVSKKAITFCREHGINEETALFSGLCIEEMAAIVTQKGFNDGRNHFMDIRLILKPGEIIIRMRDDCEQFDPRTLQHIFNPEDPFANIGIKMLANMSEELSYINALKLNNMIIKLKR